jgi:hypothetical protein
MTMLPDMCRSCAEEAGTPWPAGAKAPCTGPCDWCGNGDTALMPFADLESPELKEAAHA